MLTILLYALIYLKKNKTGIFGNGALNALLIFRVTLVKWDRLVALKPETFVFTARFNLYESIRGLQTQALRTLDGPQGSQLFPITPRSNNN